MTRNANQNKMALLDLTTRHTWKVKKREENSVLTVDDIIDPEIGHLKIDKFQEPLPELSESNESESFDADGG